MDATPPSPTPIVPPFTCVYTPTIPALLAQLRCSLALSTYQAGKVIFLSPAASQDRLMQLPRNFPKPMGIALHGQRLAVATRDHVQVFHNSPDLAASYPKAQDLYDALFLTRASYYTGLVDIHDLEFGADNKLYAVNTLFSCLVEINDRYSFEPIWQPWFVSKLCAEDRCHLNGMALEEGRPRYATAFGTTDTRKGWRAGVTSKGVLIDVQHNTLLAEDLPMPHSPRLWQGQLYVLFSATGQFVRVDRQTGQWQEIANLNGFVRGLDFRGDVAFVGMSKMRKTSSTFKKLQTEGKRDISGIIAVHLPTGRILGEILYQSSVEEIYDVRVLPELSRPNILTPERPENIKGLHLPHTTFWGRGPEDPEDKETTNPPT